MATVKKTHDRFTITLYGVSYEGPAKHYLWVIAMFMVFFIILACILKFYIIPAAGTSVLKKVGRAWLQRIQQNRSP